MSTFKTNVTVVGSVTATTVNGIVGLNDNDGVIQPNGTADAGTSNYAARADHVHAGGSGSTTLDGLTDVDTAGVTNGQALLYDSTSSTQKPGTVSATSSGDGLEIVLNTTGNGGTTYTLSKAVAKVLVIVDGIVQTDYTQPNNTTSLVMGFNVDTTETITAYSFSGGTGGAGATTLDGLTDVEATSPQDGDTLVYNADLSKWVLESVSHATLIDTTSYYISDATGTYSTFTVPTDCDYMLVCYSGYSAGADTAFNTANNQISIAKDTTGDPAQLPINIISRNTHDGECADFVFFEISKPPTGACDVTWQFGYAGGGLHVLFFKNVHSAFPRVQWDQASAASTSPVIVSNLALASPGDLMVGLTFADNAPTTNHNGQTVVDSGSINGMYYSIAQKQASSDFTSTFVGGSNYATSLAIIIRSITKAQSATGTIELDFGAYPGKNETDATVTNLIDISLLSKATAWFVADSTTTDHTTNDHKYASLLIKLVCSLPSANNGFVIYGLSEHKMQGKFKVHQAYTT